MKFAAFETSTEWCSAAVWIDGEIASLEERAGNRHGELVLPMLDRLVAAAGLDRAARCGRVWRRAWIVHRASYRLRCGAGSGVCARPAGYRHLQPGGNGGRIRRYARRCLPRCTHARSVLFGDRKNRPPLAGSDTRAVRGAGVGADASGRRLDGLRQRVFRL